MAHTKQVLSELFASYLNLKCIIIFCMMPTFVFAQAAGIVIFKSGNPVLNRDNEPPALISQNDDVNAGDTINTQSGRVQLSFIDGAKVSLQPNTVYKINRYEFSGQEDGTEYALTALIKGGLRTISGLIGHKNRDHYQLETPVATIGIRGTEFTVLYTDKLILTTNLGSVHVCNQGGCRNVVTGQSVSTTNKQTQPQFTNEVAKVTLAPPSAHKPVYVQAEQLDKNRVSLIVVESAERLNQNIFQTPSGSNSNETIVGNTTNQNTTDILISAIGKQSNRYLNYILTEGTMGSNANNNLTSYDDGNYNIKIISANTNDFYSDAHLTMGRGKGMINNVNLESFSYIAGGAIQTSGLTQLANLNTTFQYNVIASTSPVITNASGNTIAVGTPNSVTGSMNVNFANYDYNFNLNVPVGALNYNISGNNSLTAGSAEFSSNAQVTSNLGNIACVSGCSGTLTDINGDTAVIVGRFIGDAAERAGVQYGVTTGIINKNALTGSVVLAK